jgi:hypothetical protein
LTTPAEIFNKEKIPMSRKTLNSRSQRSTRRLLLRTRAFERLEDRSMFAGLVFDSVLGIGNETTNFTSASNGYDLAVDAGGSKYVTGVFYSTQDFDPGSEWTDGSDILTPPGGTIPGLSFSYEAFVAKYGPDNKLQWARQMGSDQTVIAELDMGMGIDVDAAGNVYVTGVFTGTSTFGSLTLTSTGHQDVFITKLDAEGNFLWANSWGEQDRDSGEDISVDTDGNVLAVGYTTTTTTSGGWYADGMQIHKYSPDGDTLWTRQIDSTWGTASKVTTDSAGNVLVAGGFDGVTDFDPDPSRTHYVVPSWNGNAYVLKLTGAGEFVWVSPLLAKASSSDVALTDIALDANENIIGGGTYKGQIDFNPSAQIEDRLPAPTNYAGFVAKLSSAGSLTWATPLGEGSATAGVTADQQTVYATGTFSNIFSPGVDISIASNGGNDLFVAELSSAGVVQSAVGIGGAGTESSTALVADGNGSIHAVGVFNGTVDFNPDPLEVYELTNPAKSDLFLLTLTTPGFHVTPTAGLVTSESGTTASFTVALQSPPAADVFVPIYSSNTAEASVSTSGLIITAANWNVPQIVTVTGVDDSLADGDVAYTIILGAAESADPVYDSLDPHDMSAVNIDNDIPPTKFYVVNDASQNQNYEYGPTGAAVENYALNSGNSAPRGVATTAAGDKTWVVDANKKVYIYSNSGALLGSWTAGGLASNATVEGIATNGTDVWIVDARQDRVYRYSGAASRLSGSQNAASSFALNSGNRDPTDVVTDGTHLWVVNNSTADRVFKYTISGSLVGSWTISSGGGSPTGITVDPSYVSDIWIVDNASDRVYQFTAAASRTSGSQAPAASFALAAGNTNPQGIADPPTPAPWNGSTSSISIGSIGLSLASKHSSSKSFLDAVSVQRLLAEPESTWTQRSRIKRRT